jgi:ferredoxin/uncharacterized membrane protein SirB2
MNSLQKIGIALFVIGIGVFTAILGLGKYKLAADAVQIENEYHQKAFMDAAYATDLFDKTYDSNIALMNTLHTTFERAQQSLQSQTIPEGVNEWDFKLGDWKFKEYFTPTLVKNASLGTVKENPMMWWFMSVGIALLGGLFYILPKFSKHPGIQHNGIYHNPMERGLTWKWRAALLAIAIPGILIWGFLYLYNWFWPLLTAVVVGIIIGLVMYYQHSKNRNPQRSAGPSMTGWLGIITGIYMISFYILLYWAPHYITGWMNLFDPFSEALNGGPASQWFVYGMLYTLIIIVMGVRMFAKYQHNRYQLIRTGSVMFFQTAFAFLIPEILSLLNKPSMDLKNIWPLNYSFFFDYNIDNLISSGGLGIFMLVWGIVLVIIAVPMITYFFGKRWYCSWVCGCGGLAETLGDPYRQLSDKSMRAWKYERWIIHGVLVFAIVMTAMTLYTYFSGSSQILGFNSYNVRSWYGFLIGAGFSGVVGTGFYPLMGNRVWCRFGCPLAAYLGLVQRFKSRFRITTNGGQCISCGNCSTYCEMGIDVRSYAQKGQDIVRASCVGCGVCAAVCPRGVLRLENGGDVDQRTEDLRAIHISESEVRLLS